KANPRIICSKSQGTCSDAGIFVRWFHDMSFRHATTAQSAGNCSSRDFVFVGYCFDAVFRAGAVYKGGRQVMRVLMRPAAVMFLIAAGLLFVPAVPAANAQVQSPSPGLSNPSSAIPDQKLDAAAAAIERVASLKQDYQQRIAAAAPADKEDILNEAIHALAKAITDQGLSVEEYDSILEVAQNDPDVREKIRQRIRPSAE